MPRITLTKAEKKAGLDLRDVLGPRNTLNAPKKPTKKAKAKSAKRIDPRRCPHRKWLDSIDLKRRAIRTCSACGTRLPTGAAEKLRGEIFDEIDDAIDALCAEDALELLSDLTSDIEIRFADLQAYAQAHARGGNA